MSFEILFGNINEYSEKVDAVVNVLLENQKDADERIFIENGDVYRQMPKKVIGKTRHEEIKVGQINSLRLHNTSTKYLLSTVEPVCSEKGDNEKLSEAEKLLEASYINTLNEAKKLGCNSIVFPWVDTSKNKLSFRRAFNVVQTSIKQWLNKDITENTDFKVLLVITICGIDKDIANVIFQDIDFEDMETYLSKTRSIMYNYLHKSIYKKKQSAEPIILKEAYENIVLMYVITLNKYINKKIEEISNKLNELAPDSNEEDILRIYNEEIFECQKNYLTSLCADMKKLNIRRDIRIDVYSMLETVGELFIQGIVRDNNTMDEEVDVSNPEFWKEMYKLSSIYDDSNKNIQDTEKKEIVKRRKKIRNITRRKNIKIFDYYTLFYLLCKQYTVYMTETEEKVKTICNDISTLSQKIKGSFYELLIRETKVNPLDIWNILIELFPTFQSFKVNKSTYTKIIYGKDGIVVSSAKALNVPGTQIFYNIQDKKYNYTIRIFEEEFKKYIIRAFDTKPTVSKQDEIELENYIEKKKESGIFSQSEIREIFSLEQGIPDCFGIICCKNGYLEKTILSENFDLSEGNLSRLNRVFEIKDDIIKKMRNITKESAVALAIHAHASLEDTEWLLNTAGYTLSKSNPFDKFVYEYIMKAQYDSNLYNLDTFNDEFKYWFGRNYWLSRGKKEH